MLRMLLMVDAVELDPGDGDACGVVTGDGEFRVAAGEGAFYIV